MYKYIYIYIYIYIYAQTTECGRVKHAWMTGCGGTQFDMFLVGGEPWRPWKVAPERPANEPAGKSRRFLAAPSPRRGREAPAMLKSVGFESWRSPGSGLIWCNSNSDPN